VSARATLRVTALTAICVSMVAGKSSSFPLVEGCGYSCDYFDKTWCTAPPLDECQAVIQAVCEDGIESIGGPDCVRACPVSGSCSSGCTGEPGGPPPPADGVTVHCDT
jgi:hypothetical protein